MESGNRGDFPEEDLKEWSIGPDDETRLTKESDVEKSGLTLSPGPSELGGNRLLRIVGRGGMGEVWLAHDPRLDRHVAVKVMGRALAADPQAVNRFYREARAVARLNHPNIVQIHQVGEEHGVSFFSMEWVDGETLADVLRRHGPLSLRQALEFMMPIVEGLAYACENGVAHRDVKPGNVLLDKLGRVKIADFGLARFLDGADAGQTTATGVPMGSPNYMSPEQARGEVADQRSDIYSLGITLYQMLTGQLPHSGATPVAVLIKQVQEPLPEPQTLRCLANGTVMEVIRRMTAKRPEERFQTYGELKTALAMLWSFSSGVGALPPGVAPRENGAGWQGVNPVSRFASDGVAPLSLAAGQGAPVAPRPGLRWRTLVLVAVVALAAGGIVGGAFVGARKYQEGKQKKAQQAQVDRNPQRKGKKEREMLAPGKGEEGTASLSPPPDLKPVGQNSAAPQTAPGRRPFGPGRGLLAGRLRQQMQPAGREEVLQAEAAYDFSRAALVLEGIAAARRLPSDQRMEAEKHLEETRTLQNLRQAIENEAARQSGRTLHLPGRGLVTLAGRTADGFLLRDARGEHPLPWVQMKPVEVIALATQLLPEGADRDRKVRIFEQRYR